MKLLTGKKIADKILLDLKGKIRKEKIKPGLAVVLVGKNPASETYVRIKEKAAQKAGIGFYLFRFSARTKESEVIKKIKELNRDEKISGIIVQLPLPAHLDKQKIIDIIDLQKDADGFCPENRRSFLEGSGKIYPPFPRAIMELLKSAGKSLKNKRGLVVCNSDNFGKIMRGAMEREGIEAEYVLAEEIKIPPSPLYKGGEKNLPFQKGVPSQRGEGFLRKMKSADIIISAVGKPGIIRGEMLKKGAIVIDGGIAKKGKCVLGDVDFESVKKVAGYLSPVPGGVGPVTVACLLENVYLLTKKQKIKK